MPKNFLNRHALFSAPILAALTGCTLSPEPLDPVFISGRSHDLLSRVTADQEPVTRPISLHEAMARSLKYNLDHRVEEFEHALRVKELGLSDYTMLPGIVAGSGYSSRGNDLASSSFNLLNKTQNFGYSTSQDREQLNKDLILSWNVLDFGLSYVRAKQAGDKVLIAEEGRRKIVQRIIEDVRQAYWRAASAERLDARLQRLEGRTRRALSDTAAIAAQRATSPVTAATYRRDLLEVIRTTQELRRELAVAKIQLAALMNIRPGTAFKLAGGGRHSSPSSARMSRSEMIMVALENRSELRDVDYRRRINAHEARAALLEMLPGIQVFVGGNQDANSYLLNSNWMAYGAKASWNLLRVFQYPAREGVIDAQDKLLDQRALALTMAIMTQIEVSHARYRFFTGEASTARDYLATQTDLVTNLSAEHGANKISEQTLLREQLNLLVAEAKADIANANVEAACGTIDSALGIAPSFDPRLLSAPVSELASGLNRGNTNSWKPAQIQPVSLVTK